MPFSEHTKLQAKQNSAFRCCICHKPFVEVHHIKPQGLGGDDTLDNAAPLCASCHDLFGGNPEKQKQIRQMRDDWWELMEQRKQHLLNLSDLDDTSTIEESPQNTNHLKSKSVILYHCVFANETFEEAVQALFTLTKSAQQEWPNQKRILFMDIDGHRNSAGGFDWGMYELQAHFILEFLFPFLHEVHSPLLGVRNSKLQQNDLPDYLFPATELDNQVIRDALDREDKIVIEGFKLGQNETQSKRT